VTIDREVGQALLAGWISGAAMAFATTAIVLVVLSRDDGWRARFRRTTLRLPLVGIVVINGMMLGWTLVGLVLGAVTLWMDQPGFTVAVAAMLALGMLMWVTVVGRPGWAVLSTVGVALSSFGGLLPFLVSLD
jgi:hypothetical protein